MKMDLIVQIAAIISPILAVLLAWWTSKSSTKAANKQIAAMKEMEKMQINLFQLQLDKEISDVQLRSAQTFKKEQQEAAYNHLNSHIGLIPDSMRQMQERKNDMHSEQEYNAERLRWLNYIQKQLDNLKKQVK